MDELAARGWPLITLITLLLLTACDSGGADEGTSASEATALPIEPSFPDGPRMTWQEWKAQQKPIREKVPKDERYGWIRVGTKPDMNLWKPTDFLPKAAIDAKHVDICELPVTHRREVAKLWRWYDGERDAFGTDTIRAIARRYANHGVVQAQAMMEPIASLTNYRDLMKPGPVHSRVADWLHRAAASGEPMAMYRLADFQRSFLSSFNMDDSTWHEQVPETDFRWDESHYWYWRAARHFHTFALSAMDGLWTNYQWRKVGYLYREHVREYKWARLTDIVTTLTPYQPNFKTAEEVIEDRQPYFNEHQIALAEREVGEFIRENSERLARYRHPFGCPDLTWLNPDAPTFDWEALNDEIQQYGVQVEPAGDRWSVREEWPPNGQ